jgi:hypothetical protein
MSQNRVSSRLIVDEKNPPQFVKGLELSDGFYHEEVAPLVARAFPGLRYSAALLGGGSEIYGFDDHVSTDHDWAPKVLLFLSDVDYDTHQEKLRSHFQHELPLLFKGYPVRMYARSIKHARDRQKLKPGDQGLEPCIQICTFKAYFLKHMDIDIEKTMSHFDWLSTTQQRLGSLISGQVFHDDIGLEAIREKLAWYPNDIWIYLLASTWHRIGIDERYTGRAGSVGDNVGSMIIAMRLLRDIIRLCFLLERKYAPYSKWLGSAFLQLDCAGELHPIMNDIVGTADWKEREKLFVKIYIILVSLQNETGLSPRIVNEPHLFIRRPYTIVGGNSIASILQKEIKDEGMRRLSERWLVGNIDLITDNHAFDDDPRQRTLMRQLFE